MPSLPFVKEKPVETTLYAELIRRGLPADYARRTAGELDDHRADLLADLRAAGSDSAEAVADERLGETRQLAKKIARDYQRRSWFGRWPLVSFLLAPPVILNVVWTVVVYAILSLGMILHWMTGSAAEPEVARDAATAWSMYYFAITTFSFLIPCVVAWWYSRFALFGAQSRAYLLMACLSFGLMNGLLYHQVWIDPDDANHAMNGFGVMLGDASAMTQFLSKPVQLAQLLAPALVGVVLLWQDSRRRRSALRDGSTRSGFARLAA